MAATYGSYSPVVPLDTTWQETIQLLQADGVTPVDLTGLDVRIQLRTAVPTVAGAVQTPAPTLEFTTPGYYSVAPVWPKYEDVSIPTPTNGTILLNADTSHFSGLVSPTNAKVKLYWEVKLVNKTTDFIQPVVNGKVVFLSAVTI